MRKMANPNNFISVPYEWKKWKFEFFFFFSSNLRSCIQFGYCMIVPDYYAHMDEGCMDVHPLRYLRFISYIHTPYIFSAEFLNSLTLRRALHSGLCINRMTRFSYFFFRPHYCCWKLRNLGSCIRNENIVRNKTESLFIRHDHRVHHIGD